MLKFTDFITLYDLYTRFYGAQTQPVTQPVTQPTSADLLSAINALRTPTVQGQVQPPETIDDIVCRLGGIKVPQKGDKK